MRIEQPFCKIISTALGTVGIIWWKIADRVRIRQVLLSNGKQSVDDLIQIYYPNAQRHASPQIVELGERIQSLMNGNAVDFNLDIIALEVCRPFQRSVLLANFKIPRGWISTYGKIAEHIGATGSGRAVGQALANNPFPLIIPCHRVVRADGVTGGYAGGSEMKRKLLLMEGVDFTDRGTAVIQKMHY